MSAIFRKFDVKVEDAASAGVRIEFNATSPSGAVGFIHGYIGDGGECS